MSLEKEAGHPMRPMAPTFHWYWPAPLTVKAVYGRAAGAKGICQKLLDKSTAVNTLDPACPMAVRHSSTDRML